MTKRSDSALASLLLTNRLVEAGVKPLTSRTYWQLLAQVEDPATLLGAGPDLLVRHHGLRREIAEQVARLLDGSTSFAVELERLEQQGLHALSPFDETYPTRLMERLGTTAPPILYVAGSPALLEEAGIAVVGSRAIDDAGALIAQQVARRITAQGDVLLSGGAKGVDQLAMSAAQESEGRVVGVLADALKRRLRQPDVRRAIGAERVCFVTPFKPSAGFSIANAMARNKIIYALARFTLVVAADAERGGTWEGASEALRRNFGDVAVWTGDGAGDGNPLLVQRGARAIDDLDRLFEESQVELPSRVEQLHLGV